MKSITKKIVLLGNEGVGKTSLVKRFVHSIFNDQYLSTIGIKISKKTIQIEDTEVNLMLWDIAGNMMSKTLYQNYLKGAHGVFLVCDGTRPETYEAVIQEKDMHINVDFKESIAYLIVNKSDLMTEIDKNKLESSKVDFYTSAKTGDNVEFAFQRMAENFVDTNT
ncbi:Rab family GTPase [Crocinitomix catalasitica]|uniref:Rab family GTPase n=1 Tax=Crocinitomix catalasitica TaxID=184607 RepID=UPI00048454FB|nr:Rab family GTPase [Crocinitomix catalasitica]